MATLIHSPTSGELQGPFERTVVQALLDNLPNSFLVVHNVQLKPRGQNAIEIDFLLLAPHALYVIEAKEWYGRLSGDDTEWLLNHTAKKPPLWLTNAKCRVLVTELGALGQHVHVTPLLVLPDGIQNHLGGNWASHVCALTGALRRVQDPSSLPTKTSDIRHYHQAILQLLQGKWGARRREERRRIGSYSIQEVLYQDASSGEYLANHALLEGDQTPYRIRIFRLDQSLSDAEKQRRRAVIRRPTEAVAKIGPHPNLLRVLQFDFLEDTNEFFEVTEWSEFGTLHGYLANNERDRLTVQERLSIAEGVASALAKIHEQGVIHRNLCPETIIMGPDRAARLTDFDRAYLEGSQTVIFTTSAKNAAYVPPELADPTNYDFDTTSDMYSFGVLLYRLLLDDLPFPDAIAAVKARGVPPRNVRERRPELPPAIDTLIHNLLRVDDFKARPSAPEALAALRAAQGRSTTEVVKQPAPAEPALATLAPGEVIDSVWRIDGELGTGAFSRVFRVFNLDHKRSYAMKVLRDEGDVDMLQHEFNTIREQLPKHPNIAEIIWLGRLSDGRPYLISELVAGETLEAYCNGSKRLPWTDIKRIGGELLDALAAMHPDAGELEAIRAVMAQRSLTEEEGERYYAAQEKAETGVFHRDIKPPNIMLEMPRHRAKLIDFNIAAQASEATGKGGTPRYWAPDRGVPKWKPDADLFSLGVVLYELVAQRHPYPKDTPGNGDPYDPREIVTEYRISDELAAFLQKAVQASGADRFQTAKEMKAALDAIPFMMAPAQKDPVPAGNFPGLTVPVEEAATSNHNPYVTRLLTLYSQARRSNAGTRGLDEIARHTYVETKLDQKLAPAIASGLFRLVIVTGNAGDGKTAFLQKAEDLCRDNGAAVTALPSGNGSRFTHQGITFETNYDGSQDEGDRENDAVLNQFFEPFAGGSLGGLAGSAGRLIAINEGRLLDFLTHSAYKARFDGLRRFVLDALDGKPGPDRALLVNLNLRAVTAGGAESLVEKQLNAMLKDEIWAPCEGCAHKVRCPIKHNVDTLRNPASGAQVRERVRRLFELVHLRRQAHVTMRDLRSALSYMILRDQSCKDIARLLAQKDHAETLVKLYYPEAFADHAAEIGLGALGAQALSRDPERAERAVDRLVRRLCEADVGLPNAPSLDRRLNHDPKSAVPWMTFEGRSEHARTTMSALARSAPGPADDLSLEDLLKARRRLIARWRRWAYFERRDEGWRAMVPYRSTHLLERLVVRRSEEDFERAKLELRDAVVEAISRAEGVTSDAICKRDLALKITRSKDSPVRSYRLFPKESFRVEVRPEPPFARYLEYAPDAVELVAASGAARLRISLDLLEMLELIRNGYRPTTAELQGLFVNLLIFRNELLTTTFDRVLVTADDRELFEVRAEGRPDGIKLVLSKQATASAEEGSLS